MVFNNFEFFIFNGTQKKVSKQKTSGKVAARTSILLRGEFIHDVPRLGTLSTTQQADITNFGPEIEKRYGAATEAKARRLVVGRSVRVSFDVVVVVVVTNTTASELTQTLSFSSSIDRFHLFDH